jgi:molybdate transport system substrate-binding protein
MKFLTKIVLILFIVASSFSAYADELRVLSSVGIRGAIERLAPGFERLAGQKVAIEFGTSNSLKKKIAESSDPFDVVILTPSIVAEFVTSGLVSAPTVWNLGRSGVGLAVRTGGMKPDISSKRDLIRVLTFAPSVAYAKDGASGIHFINVMRSNGIDVDSSKLIGVMGQSPLELVAEGKAAFGVQLISEIVAQRGVDLVGPFPHELQSFTTMTVGVAKSSHRREIAEKFVNYLLSANARKVIRESGLEPTGQ